MTNARPLAVIVTGGRDYSDGDALRTALSSLRPLVVIHGACGVDGADEHWARGTMKGADSIAHQWAMEQDYAIVSSLCMPANWQQWAHSAGPRRNRRMLRVLKDLEDCGYRIAVVVCPGGKGTASMRRLSVEAGVKIVQVEHDRN